MILTLPRLPPIAEWAPWTDRKGRLHPLRSAVFALLWMPAIWLAVRGAADMLGARPVNAAIHSTGYWAAWIFIGSLVVTPAKALLGMPNIVVVRRMIGNAALCYAIVHLLLYVVDQNCRLLTVVKEILVRPYLTIGFVSFVGVAVLGYTSTDGWIKRLGRDWKRLHKLAYPLAFLALIHFFLQSKVDVSQASIAAGVFAWVMIWRFLPAGRDREPLPLALLAVAAAGLTLTFECSWYQFATKVDPARILKGEFDATFGLNPAGLVLLAGLLVVGLVQLRTLAQTRFGETVGFTMLVYALGALADDVACLAMGWSADEAETGGSPGVVLNIAWALLFALLGMARHRFRETWQRHLLDCLWAAMALSPILAMATDSRQVSLAGAAIMIAGALLVTLRLWPVSRSAALSVLPAAMFLGYAATALL